MLSQHHQQGTALSELLYHNDLIRKDPIAKELVEKLTMEVWMSEKAYVISYPISAGKDFNMVLSHHVDRLVDDVEEVDMNEFRDHYKNFDPRIKSIIDMVATAKRWPLLVTGPLDSWSSEQKNVVLMGWVSPGLTRIHMLMSM